MEMDGHTLTLRLPANNLATLHQVCIYYTCLRSNFGISFLLYADVSYTETQRIRSSSSQSLPVHMTLVGCYSSNDSLIDCAYHEFPSTTTSSMDISISCGSGNSDELNSVSVASLTVAVICASAVIILVAVLIIMFMLRQKKKRHIIR